MSRLMNGLKAKDASLQMQFFWKYLNRLSHKHRFKPIYAGDSDSHTDQNDINAAKVDSQEAGDDARLAFKQITTFFNALTALEEALLQVVFDFISRERLYKRDHFDFSHISKHLNHAIFLENDAMMFEKMPANQMLLKAAEHDIVGMAAMVLKAIYEELLFWKPEDKNWKLPVEATHLIKAFQEKFHLPLNMKLFEDWGYDGQQANNNDSNSSQALRENLKGILTDIDEQTPFKTPDYEDYYDALHGVLFDGNCSIKSLMPAYHQAWEELCLFHYYSKNDIEIVWVDNANSTIDFKISKEHKLSKDVFIDLRFRWPETEDDPETETIAKRPDLVYFQPKGCKENSTTQYTVVDFKHYPPTEIKKLLNFSPEKNSSPDKLGTDLKSLRFYAASVDAKFNPYGSNKIHSTKKVLCFPDIREIQKRTEYFDFEPLSTKKLMENYIKT